MFRHRFRTPLVLLTICSLILSECLVVAHMAGQEFAGLGRLEVALTSGMADGQTSPQKTLKTECNCVFHKRMRASSGCDSASNKKSSRTNSSGVAESQEFGADSSQQNSSQHDAEHCSICRASYTSRVMSCFVPPVIISLGEVPSFTPVEYDLPIVEVVFVESLSQRGPPV